MPHAANEILRWATPVHHFRRTATADVEFGGKQIKEMDKVTTWYISGNFDEEAFDEPFKFDVGRNPNPQMTFGPGGPHFCTGAHLARLEVEIVFEEMVKRVAEFELTATPERLQSNFFNGIKRMPLRLTPA
jgi:cytochrome P450